MTLEAETAWPVPGSRWRTPIGSTLTVQRIVRPFPQAIRSPYAECWVAGVLHRIPLDERWGRGLVPINEDSGGG